MDSQELLRIVQGRGYQGKIQSDEVLIKNCLFCGNSNWNLELNAEKGVYGCWACKSSGRLQDLLVDRFGTETRISVHLDKEEESLYDEGKSVTFGSAFKSASEVVSVKNWLRKRGIREFDISRYDIKICLDEDHSHKNRIIFPLRDYWTSEVFGYISRDYIGFSDRKYLVNIYRKSSFGYRVSDDTKPHVVVEGIIDGILVHKAGYNAHTLLGVGSNDRFIEWASTLSKNKQVVLFLDGDKEGERRSNALKHLAATVRPEPEEIRLPDEMDPGDLDPTVINHLIQVCLNE